MQGWDQKRPSRPAAGGGPQGTIDDQLPPAALKEGLRLLGRYKLEMVFRLTGYVGAMRKIRAAKELEAATANASGAASTDAAGATASAGAAASAGGHSTPLAGAVARTRLPSSSAGGGLDAVTAASPALAAPVDSADPLLEGAPASGMGVGAVADDMEFGKEGGGGIADEKVEPPTLAVRGRGDTGEPPVGGGVGAGAGSYADPIVPPSSMLSGLSPELVAALTHPVGMLTASAKADDGKELPVGVYLQVAGANSGDELMVNVYSGFNTTATIPVTSYRPEPALVKVKDDNGNSTGPRDDIYQKYKNPLWGKSGPRAADADTQGAIGDCYFMAAMGAVCAANPAAIKALITPHEPSKIYSVHFFQLAKDGTMNPTSEYQVDSWLPTVRYSDHDQAYGGGKALWVSVLEKAWAQFKGEGSYDKIQGGWPADAMAALTGVASTRLKNKPTKKGRAAEKGEKLQWFRQMEKESHAVCIGTKPDSDRKNIGWTPGKFEVKGDDLIAQLDHSLVFESVHISGPTFSGKDDSNNNILQLGGTAKLTRGVVNYQDGTVALTFGSGTRPDPTSLLVSWSHCGPEFQKYGLVGTHAYRFTGMREPDAINLSNPWGQQHPKPVDEPGIIKLFSQIASNAVLSIEEQAPSSDGPSP